MPLLYQPFAESVTLSQIPDKCVPGGGNKIKFQVYMLQQHIYSRTDPPTLPYEPQNIQHSDSERAVERHARTLNQNRKINKYCIFSQ